MGVNTLWLIEFIEKKQKNSFVVILLYRRYENLQSTCSTKDYKIGYDSTFKKNTVYVLTFEEFFIKNQLTDRSDGKEQVQKFLDLDFRSKDRIPLFPFL